MPTDVFAAVAQSKETMEYCRIVALLEPAGAATTPVPDEVQLLRMVAAGVAGVLALRPWVADALAENGTAPLSDVWGDWLTVQETLLPESE